MWISINSVTGMKTDNSPAITSNLSADAMQRATEPNTSCVIRQSLGSSTNCNTHTWNQKTLAVSFGSHWVLAPTVTHIHGIRCQSLTSMSFTHFLWQQEVNRNFKLNMFHDQTATHNCQTVHLLKSQKIKAN